MNDNIQAWHNDENQHIHTVENEEEPIEESMVNPEGEASSATGEETGMLEEKTETWKTTFQTPVGQVNVASPEELLGSEEIHLFRSRWNEIQAKFVDEPGASVRQADALVAEVMAKVTEMLANQRRALESQWNLGDTHGQASTEDLRQILQSYRAFFNRLLK
jgi:hypothetical protein